MTAAATLSAFTDPASQGANKPYEAKLPVVATKTGHTTEILTPLRVRIAVLDRDNTRESRELVSRFTGSRYFDI